MVAQASLGDAVSGGDSRTTTAYDRAFWIPRKPGMGTRLFGVLLFVTWLSPTVVHGEDYYTLIVSGASGDPRYGDRTLSPRFVRSRSFARSI